MPISDANEVPASSLNNDIALQKFRRIAIFVEDNNGSDFSGGRLGVHALCNPSWIMLFQDRCSLKAVLLELLTAVLEGF